MQIDLTPSGLQRRSHPAGCPEVAPASVLVVGAAAALVASAALVALTHGWDYRLAVMIGALLAIALARVRWRTLPAARVADRLAAAFAGTLAAGLFCVYAADWLDWRPLGVDDALAGAAVGLLLLAVPTRGLLRRAAEVPFAAGVGVAALALAPAAWTVAVYVFDTRGLDRDAAYALVELPGFAAALAVAVLGFAFALRQGLYMSAMVLSAMVWVELFLLVTDGGASVETGVLTGGIAGVGLMIASAGAWAKSMREAASGLHRRPAGELIARCAGHALTLARRLRHFRTALVSSGLVGAGLYLLLARNGVAGATGAYAGIAVAGCLALATTAARRARTRGAAARPGGLVAFLAFAGLWALMAGIEPFDWFAASAALSVWWWFYLRRGVPLFVPEAVRRQRVLRLALAGAFTATLGTYLVLLEAAVQNHTGPMVLVELRARGLYTVSEIAFARAMLADQYLWRDAVAPPGPAGAIFPDGLVAASRHERDKWSYTNRLGERDGLKESRARGHGLVTREDPGGRRVEYVYRGSPAERAGVRRGDLIRAIDGVPVSAASGAWVRTGSMHLELLAPAGAVRDVMVEAGEYRRGAIGAETVIDVAGRRVGYLELHLFSDGAHREFRAAALRLREQGIDELVLDLRMNYGGYLGESMRVASVIAGERLNGKLFKRVVYNERYRDRDLGLYIDAPVEGALRLARLFVITSEDTCSASESLINGLAAHMPVVTVGATTCGKPVGSLPLEYGEHIYSIITFRGVNARGEGDYYGGLRPTCPVEGDFAHDLGDPEEAGLKAALEYLRDGRCPGSQDRATT